MIRVVMDTNVFISAGLTPHGIPRRILDRILFGEGIKLILSPEILEEYEGVSSRPKFSQRRRQLGKLLRRMRKHAAMVVPTEEVSILSDADDNKFLACAKTAQADFLVTGNRIDFQLKVFEDTVILSPRDFWKRITSFEAATHGTTGV